MVDAMLVASGVELDDAPGDDADGSVAKSLAAKRSAVRAKLVDGYRKVVKQNGKARRTAGG